jgi:hypothetical protein
MVLWGSLTAFALATAACGTSPHETASGRTTSSTTRVTSTSTATTQSVSLTGCLQEGSRGTYILTDLNRPKQPDTSSPVVVAREKLAAAEEAYVLSSHTKTDLSGLVGDRVHVEGTLASPSDLLGTQPKAGGESVGTAGAMGEVKAIESGRVIKEKDLAKVDVVALRKIADTCGTRADGPARRSK